MRSCLVVGLVFLSLPLFSQVSNIEIVSSSSQLVNKVHALRNKFQYEIELKSEELYRTINLKFVLNGKDTFEVFTFSEITIAYFHFGDYEQLLNGIHEGYDFHSKSSKGQLKERKNIYYYSNLLDYPINEFQYIIRKLKMEESSIIERIDLSNLSDMQKEFLKLYLQSILAFDDLSHFDTVEFEANANKFITQFSTSVYSKYVKEYLNIKFKPNSIVYGWFGYSGVNVLNGKIGDLYSTSVPIGIINLDLGYKEIFLRSWFEPSYFSRINQTFVYRGYELTRNENVGMVNYGLNIYYSIWKSTKMKLSPYLGIANRSYDINPNLDYMMFNSGFDVGINIEYKKSDVKSKNKQPPLYKYYVRTFQKAKRKTNSSYKLSMGVSKVNNDDDRLTGYIFSLRLGLSFNLQEAKMIEPFEEY